MKFLIYGLSAFLFVVILGCAKTGENSGRMDVDTLLEGLKTGKLVVNEEHDEIRAATSLDGTPGASDFSGTYKGPDGTLVIKKVSGVHLMKSPPVQGYSETVAVLPAQVGTAKKKNYTDTGAIAPNAYLITSTLNDCPIKINNLAVMQDNFFTSSDMDGPTYTIMRRDNGSLELDFPMAMVRGKSGNCMNIAPFVKMAK